MNKLSWVPRLHGSIYCSTACGCGCTKEAYDEAYINGNMLINRLGTDDWKVRVWENFGWHFCAVYKHEDISISENNKTSYTCYYNGPIQKIGRADTPRGAFNSAVELMTDLHTEISDSLLLV